MGERRRKAMQTGMGKRCMAVLSAWQWLVHSKHLLLWHGV